MSSSVGKRERERQKLDKAQAKAERKTARRATDTLPAEISSHRSEAELIEDLAGLHQAFEAGEISPEDFEKHRDELQVLFEQLSR